MLDHVVWQDIHNTVVQTEAEAYGQKTRYSLLHPEKLVFCDEVGGNISQKGDGNADGKKSMVAKEIMAQVRNSFKDNHFTFFGFTAMDGRAIMCTLIIAASKLKVSDVVGSNPLSKDTEEMISNEVKVLEEEVVHYTG
jgi:hypothetical protein